MDNNEMVVKLENRDGEIWACSRDVAETFGKEPKHVNEAIKKTHSRIFDREKYVCRVTI